MRGRKKKSRKWNRPSSRRTIVLRTMDCGAYHLLRLQVIEKKDQKDDGPILNTDELLVIQD